MSVNHQPHLFSDHMMSKCNVPLLDTMMHLQLSTKLLPQRNKLPDTHPLAPLPAFTRAVQNIPGFSEVAVEVVHMFGHAVVDTEVMLAKLGKGCFFWLWFDRRVYCGRCGDATWEDRIRGGHFGLY